MAGDDDTIGALGTSCLVEFQEREDGENVVWGGTVANGGMDGETDAASVLLGTVESPAENQY